MMFVYSVMRLTKPALMVGQPLPCIPTQRMVGEEGSLSSVSTDLALVDGLENFALGQLLTLPQNFG